MSDVESNPVVRRIEALLAEVREAEEQSQGTLRELHSTLRSITQACDRADKIIANLKSDCEAIVQDRYGGIIKDGLNDYVEELKHATETARLHVIRHFDEIVYLLTTGNKQGRTQGGLASSLLNAPGVDYQPLAKPGELGRALSKDRQRHEARKRKPKGNRR